METFSEKSEKPTAKRLKQAQKEGEFAYSPKFASALFLFAACLLIAFYTIWFIPLLKEIVIISMPFSKQEA